jgi:hypothetical protein
MPALRFYLCCWVALAAALPAAAQAPPTLSDDARASLITILPGDAVYSAWGHSAFRIYDPALDFDATYNYGTFDFGSVPSFVLRFAYGELDYFLSVAPSWRTVRVSELERRPVIEQVLNLEPAEVQELYRLLQTNARPENRTYRYDFLFDNCSTRLRDILAATLGPELSFAGEPDPDQSFRDLIDPYLADQRFLDFGLDLLLGAETDREATPEEASFLPLYLKRAFDAATLVRDSTTLPLVARTDTLYWVDGRVPGRASLPWPQLIGWLLFGLGVLMTVRHYRRRTEPGRLGDGLLFGILGLAGVVMLVMWCWTLHHVTAQNWNLLWAWPTHLVAAFMVVRRRDARWLRIYWTAAAAAALVVVIAWPLWPQELPTAAIPLVLLIALRSSWLAYRPGISTPVPAVS